MKTERTTSGPMPMVSALPVSLLEDALRTDQNAIAFATGRLLTERFPSRYVLQTRDHDFDLDEFVRLGHATSEPHPTLYSEWLTEWEAPSGPVERTTRTAHTLLRWESYSFDVIALVYQQGYCSTTMHFVIGDDRETVETLFETVCETCHVPKQQILVFAHGCWSKSQRLYKAVTASSFDDLVLADHLGETIRDDITRFLSAKAEYARYGVPYKRGILLVGPPGNGKTHCLRAIVKHAGLSTLYVKSVKTSAGEEEANVAAVFERARSLAPCVLVFEDLDSLVTKSNLSSFLNEMDGLAGDTGVLTLATTNHPASLDPALLDRPSRFDRKYQFPLPTESERTRYVTQWNDKLDARMRLSSKVCARIAKDTAGFSYAYLKELFVSSMLRWMEKQADGTMEWFVTSELALLSAQRKEPKQLEK